MASWTQQPIRAVLLDITGVLYESGEGGGHAIDGSIDAVARLKQSGLPVRFCTNETQCTRRMLVEKLGRHGYSLKEEELFPPIPAVCQVLREKDLRPHLLVHPDAMKDFDGIDTSNPNCVVMGDAGGNFSYDNVNKAFQLLIGMEQPKLITMGLGRYYSEAGSLVLDCGPYAKALEFACSTEAEVVGKPSPAFFQSALKDMGAKPNETVMVGDDIVSDVGGAQACGMRGIQVRTGKFRPSDENHPTVKPDGYVDNLAQAVDLILQQRS